MPVLNDCTFLYCKLNKPVTKYQSTDKEFVVDICISKTAAKAWNKQFPKQKCKEVDNEEFTKIFKIDPPFPDQDEQFVLKAKKSAQYKDGKPLPEELQPKVLVKQANGKLKNVAKTVLVSNGSKGVMEYDTLENDYGIFFRLKNLRVDHLIEYQSATSSELGDIEEDDEISSGDPSTSLGNVEEDEPVAQESKKASKKASKPVDDEDEDSPF